ncbi:MAG: heavy metal translocating P-type ATPase metal-binding domain-containing protein [Bacteroidetes bacterium]|nr:heavy metal translocating P-type ATPase metal-binding domain-containing protein [Bacteroidota bacterium]
MKEILDKTLCFHCGDECRGTLIELGNKNFCCNGCKTVYQIIEGNNLCDYYQLDAHPGIQPQYANDTNKWQWLDADGIGDTLCQFRSKDLAIITLHIPGIHCASCIYLLEKLPHLAVGVIAAEVDFLKKTITIKYNPAMRLSSIANVLSRLGYTPVISMKDGEEKSNKKSDRSLVYKIGVAGFFAGNIMMLSLPEYLDSTANLSPTFTIVFRVLSAVFAAIVLGYAGQDFFKSAWGSLWVGKINMDVPLAFGLGAIALDSYYEVFTNNGSGYFDSLCGLIFMLLVGRFFQKRTFNALNFNRDYKSYFPLAVTKILEGKEFSVKVNSLEAGDEIKVRNGELIPADAKLLSTATAIDYSFVTGESDAQPCMRNDTIFAGGRNKGAAVRLKVINKVEQSYLTKLWNADAFRKNKKEGWGNWSAKMAEKFSVAVLTIAFITAGYWYLVDSTHLLRPVISVLVIVCPCVLALAVPFTFGAMHSIFSKNGMYLKDAESLEQLAQIDTIVFDKTGTLTLPSETKSSITMDDYDMELCAAVVNNSMHPVSIALKNILPENIILEADNLQEISGAGIKALVDGKLVRIGLYDFVSGNQNATEKLSGTYVSIDGQIKGKFNLNHSFREDVKEVLDKLKISKEIYVLSGDNTRDKEMLSQFLSEGNIHFHQAPQDKMDFISSLKNNHKKVMMIGDGLNDAGALQVSNFGVTVNDDINAFSPASDAILDAKFLGRLPQLIRFAAATKRIIYTSFLFSILYNSFGLYFAVQGLLAPWVAAVLMPISSITVVLYTQGLVRWAAYKNKLEI